MHLWFCEIREARITKLNKNICCKALNPCKFHDAHSKNFYENLGRKIMSTLITSVLVLTQLFSELVTDNEGKGTVSILLGLDLDEFSGENEGLELKIPFLFFAFVYAVASSILIWGSIVEIRYYAFPWLICEALSFATQVATFTIICINFVKKIQVDRWVILLTVCNLFLSVYFWIVVFCAQRTWARLRRAERENVSTTTLSSGNDTIHDMVDERPTTTSTLTDKRIEIDPSTLSAHPDKSINLHFQR